MPNVFRPRGFTVLKLNPSRLRSSLAGLVLTIGCALALPVAALAAPERTIDYVGDSSSATGNAVGKGSCDVNGDDYADALVGAWFWDKPPASNIGAAYVLLGGEQRGGGDLNTPNDAGAVRIDAPSNQGNNLFVGFSIDCAGDTNGDGFDDIVLSDYVNERAYVVLGAEEFSSVDLEFLGERGYLIKGSTDPAFDFNVATGVAGVGDLNGDGLDEIAVAGVVADHNGRNNSGSVWVVAGKQDVADVDLLNPGAGEVLMRVDGAAAEDRLGQVAPAGDVDGDGVEDIVVGAYTATPRGTAAPVAGAAWVLSGAARGNVDLASVGDQGFRIVGPERGRDRLGISVAAAGDVDGDGLDDVLIGGDGVYNAATGQRPGSAWVVLGSASNADVLTKTDGNGPSVRECPDQACASPIDRGYWIKGADSDPGNGSESTGYSLDGIGDVNADGTPDFAIGAYGYDPADPANPGARLTGAGATFVVHGDPVGGDLDLATLTAAQGYRIDGTAAGDRYGRSVGALGDFDDNGIDDFVSAGDFAARTVDGAARSQAGVARVSLLDAFETQTALDSSADPSLAGDDLTLTASVSRTDDSSAVEPGSVAFSSDGEPIAGCESVALEDGVATCSAAFETAGEYELGADYSGAGGFSDSSAAALTQTVDRRPTPPSIERAAFPLRFGTGGRATIARVNCGIAPQGCTVAADVGVIRIRGVEWSFDVRATGSIESEASTAVRAVLPAGARRALRKGGSGRILTYVEASSGPGERRWKIAGAVLAPKRSGR